ncbi:transporter substrate-binding domain-containing protein [Desulfocurvibacter africanus]|uniref:histidine kinase n=1 Tax=Desulfocurvibacter africanus subsp. africanus str. Walvis Bay TaxID=690850 RepID=F3YWC6_DESAF|nr:transporter substrate-binding domain-containing protein [Desulfocurvibacter africanus]EGJ49312.1 histidine kinase [Desulfocurvibacter africanus subsp. africanus str. Walvis Bay]
MASLSFWMHARRSLPRICVFVLAALLVAVVDPGLCMSEEIPGKSRPILVGGDRDYPPYEFLDQDGNPVGFNVDLTRAVAEVMGMKVEFHLGTWAHKRQALMDGDLDILQGMTYSEPRSRVVDFAPHTIVNHAIFARRGTPPVSNLDDLAGKQVIIHRSGYMNDTLAAKGFGKDLILPDTPADVLRLLSSGQGEYAVVAMLPGIYITREFRLDNIQQIVRSVATVRYGYAVKKGNEALLARFSEGLAILRETGRYQEIHDKWLGVLEHGRLRWESIALYVAATVSPLLALLGGSMLWTHILRKKVAERTASLTMAMEELSRNQRQLVQAGKLAALGTLVSGVAHEINNPNGLILLNIPILRRTQADTIRLLDARREHDGEFTLGGIPYDRMRQEIPRMMDEMHEGALRIKRIVNDLKNFARPDESMNKALMDLNDASRKAVRLVEPTIRKYTDRFTTNYEADLPLVWGNSQRIEQVVVNLVLNACQSLPDKSRGIVISTRHDQDAGKVVLCVRDEGTGIAPEHLPHVTDPFFTTKRDTGGTGLGLSVSAGILKEQGGCLVFDSVPGQGTSVRMELPVTKEDGES